MGSYNSSTYLQSAQGIAFDNSTGMVYVAAYDANRLTTVDVGTIPTSPSFVASYQSEALLDGAYDVDFDVRHRRCPLSQRSLLPNTTLASLSPDSR